MKITISDIVRGKFTTYMRPALIMLFVLVIHLPGKTQQDESQTIRPNLEDLDIIQRGEKTPLDRPIDPQTYNVGPGDQLRVFIWGNIQAQYDLLVTPEGKVLIPTIGPIDISGMYLAEAKSKIENQIYERFRNVEVTVDLIGLRTFKVSVGGAVNFPGIYTANGVTRVSEIIALAGGFIGENEQNEQNEQVRGSTLYQPAVFPKGVASHRNIEVRSLTGAVRLADILLFEQAGDLRYNYKLNDGDEIFVPLSDKDVNLYGIFGGVKNPAYFEYSSRDSLTDLIKLAHGLALDSDSARAELVRFEADGKTFRRELIDLKLILSGELADLPMEFGDRVFVKIKKDFNAKHQVLILGEVKYPGFYAIKPESTYLSQIILEAGGFTRLASLAEAEMTRFVDEKIADREFERLKQMEIPDMSDLEYEYFKVKSREKPGRVAVDFPELFLGDAQSDIKLENGDVVIIPKISEVVAVSGEVANPGLLAYNPKYDFSDYIKLAGGYSFRANKGKVRIIKAVTGEWKKAGRKTILKPGDTILVPEKRKVDYWKTVREVIAFTANVATVYIVIKEATR